MDHPSALVNVLIWMRSEEIKRGTYPGANPFWRFERTIQSPCKQALVQVVRFSSLAGAMLCRKSRDFLGQEAFLLSKRKDRKNPICDELAGFFMVGGFILLLIIAGFLFL